MDDLAAGVRVRHLALPLERATSVPSHQGAAEAANELRKRQFDAAPVLADGRLVGVFHVEAVKSSHQGMTVSDVMHPLSASLVVSAEAPLSALLRRMCHEPFLFVVDESGIGAFVTPADLGTVPVRSHFYLKLARLESALGAHLRATYADQMDAIALLPRRRRDGYARIATSLRAKDMYIDDLSCVSLDDLVTLAGMDERFRAATGKEGMQWDAATDGLADFRNEIMHPGRTFADAPDSRPSRLVEWEDRLGALLRAAEQQH